MSDKSDDGLDGCSVMFLAMIVIAMMVFVGFLLWLFVVVITSPVGASLCLIAMLIGAIFVAMAWRKSR